MPTSVLFPIVDGRASRGGGGQSFSGIRSGDGDSSNGTTDPINITALDASGQANPNYSFLARGVLGFFPNLPIGARVTSGSIGMFVTEKQNNHAQSVGVTAGTPSSFGTLDNSDYNLSKYGTTKLTNDIDIDSLGTGAMNYWTLNSSGLSYINQNPSLGTFGFGVRLSCDIDNSAPAWSGTLTRVQVNTTKQSGTANDPRLILNYEIVSGALLASEI